MISHRLRKLVKLYGIPSKIVWHINMAAASSYNLPEKLCLGGDLPSNWKRFKQQLSIYLIASGLDDEKDKRKIAIFLNVIGEEGVQIYNNFGFDKLIEADGKNKAATFDDVLKSFDQYCEPKKNVLFSRFLFYKRSQLPGEPFDVYFTDLKSLARNCEFTNEDEAIRDRIIFGTTNKSEQENLLSMGDVDLDKTVKRLRLSEVTKSQIKEVQCDSAEVGDVHKVQVKNPTIQCKWCGVQHERDIKKCPARGVKCTKCEKYSAKKSKEPMLLDEIPTLPFQKIACDFLQWNSKTYLIVTDYYSKWFDLIHVNSLTASTVINILKNIFSTHGIPRILRADNMPFNSFEFQNFAALWNIKLITSSPKYPRSNGFVERFVGIAKNLLNKSTESGVDFQEVLLEYRNTPVLGSQYTPSQLLFSRLTRTKLPIHDVLLKPKVVMDFKETQHKVNMYNKKNFDKTAKCNKHTFYSGQDVVYLRENVWVPAIVVDIHSSPRSLILKDVNGQIIRRNTLHVKPSFHKNVNSPQKCYLDLINNEQFQPEEQNVSIERRNSDSQDVVAMEDAQEQVRDFQLRPRRNIVPPKHLADYVC